jgi:hypothetical protein
MCMSTGGYALACQLDLISTLEPGFLAAYPKLSLFFETIFATAAFDGVRDAHMYLTRV